MSFMSSSPASSFPSCPLRCSVPKIWSYLWNWEVPFSCRGHYWHAPHPPQICLVPFESHMVLIASLVMAQLRLIVMHCCCTEWSQNDIQCLFAYLTRGDSLNGKLSHGTSTSQKSTRFMRVGLMCIYSDITHFAEVKIEALPKLASLWQVHTRTYLLGWCLFITLPLLAPLGFHLFHLSLSFQILKHWWKRRTRRSWLL